jgi:hypothetical protein
MNVTDSLAAITREIDRAANCLSPALVLADHDHGGSCMACRVALGRIEDTLGILKAAQLVAQREAQLLAEAGNLLRSKACGHCAEPFEYTPTTGRGPIYCSSACRQAAYRTRAYQAQQ